MEIWHNPRCTKSRQTLALLEEAGVDFEIVLYLQSAPCVDQLRAVLSKLQMEPRALLRKGEDEYKLLGLSDSSKSDEEVLRLMNKHPKLIERPIVISGKRAVIGRPPEKVEDLLG